MPLFVRSFAAVGPPFRSARHHLPALSSPFSAWFPPPPPFTWLLVLHPPACLFCQPVLRSGNCFFQIFLVIATSSPRHSAVLDFLAKECIFSPHFRLFPCRAGLLHTLPLFCSWSPPSFFFTRLCRRRRQRLSLPPVPIRVPQSVRSAVCMALV